MQAFQSEENKDKAPPKAQAVALPLIQHLELNTSQV